MKPTRIVLLLFIILISFSLLLIPGCAKKEDEGKKESAKKDSPSQSSIQSGGVYRVPLMNNPSSLDPIYIKGRYGVAVVQQLFDGLVQFDSYLTVLPSLAETWQVENDGKTYKFVLRENARFHNGRPVTTEDVVFSLSRLLRVDPPQTILPHLLKISGAEDYRSKKSEQIQGFDIIDDRTIRIRLEEPHVPFLTALGMYQAKIVPQKEIIELGNRFWENPVGSGPFRFVSWDKNEMIQLERFSEYYAGQPFLDKIHYIVYPGGEIEKVLTAFREGRLEEMPVYGKMKQELETESGLQWFQRPSLSLFYYGINCSHPILKSDEVRKALSMAIDRKKLVKEIYKDRFEPAKTILPPGMPGYHRKQATVVDDVAKARELIKSAEKSFGSFLQPFEIVSSKKSSFAQAELNFIKESWAQLGISLNIKYITDWKEFAEYRRSESVQIYRVAWFADMPDPDSFLYPLFASGSPVNYMRYQNKEVDQMLQTARGIIDPEERAKMYQQIEEIILESSPVIPLFYLSVDRVYRPIVQDIQVSALGAHTMSLHRVWLKAGSAQP